MTAMRLSLFILGVFAAVICVEIPAEAQNGGWCAYYDLGSNGFRSCRFATFQAWPTCVGLAGTVDLVRTPPRRYHIH